MALAKLSALRLGRRLVAEVPAAPGRRAFVDITPILDQRDHVAKHEGWTRPDRQRSYRLAHWDYDERQIDGWDYDLGARQVRVDTCGEPRLLDLITRVGTDAGPVRLPVEHRRSPIDRVRAAGPAHLCDRATRDLMTAEQERHPTYHEAFASLAHVVLEESWVVTVDVSLTRLILVVDLALTPAHPDYRPPLQDETHCYRLTTLLVDSDTAILVRRSTTPPAVDATGELDYGHIDTFCPITGLDDDVWELTGDWGDALVRQPRIHVDLDTTPPS